MHPPLLSFHTNLYRDTHTWEKILLTALPSNISQQHLYHAFILQSAQIPPSVPTNPSVAEPAVYQAVLL
ncbi:hypothetical protein XENTR_v10006820 [Xenopus tropicalis]|nr:hypothetical protein XENTR_v10006820 [Xenopus tropicalis]